MLYCEMWLSEREDVEERCLPPWIRRSDDSGTDVRTDRSVVRFAIDVSDGMDSGIAAEDALVVVLEAQEYGVVESCADPGSWGSDDLLSPEMCLMKI